MRILVCGDREYRDEALIHAMLTGLFSEHYVGFGSTHTTAFTLIEGCARGADAAAHWWGRHSPLHPPSGVDVGYGHNHPAFRHLCFPADWSRYGKAAGPIRNQEMLTMGMPDLVLAFHDNIARSKGTKNMLSIAKKAGIETRLISAY